MARFNIGTEWHFPRGHVLRHHDSEGYTLDRGTGKIEHIEQHLAFRYFQDHALVSVHPYDPLDEYEVRKYDGRVIPIDRAMPPETD